MVKWEVNGVQRGLLWAKAGALLSGVAYAGLLSTRIGRRIEREHTWFAVMGGVFITLGWLATEDKRASERSFFYFVCTGLPMVARALYLYSHFVDNIIDREIGRGDKI